MERNSKIIIIGAGVFGLSTAYQLACEGYTSITVLDRYKPPVQDGSSVDISRVIRFDYADETYLRIAHDAYKEWLQNKKYEGIFRHSPFILTSHTDYGQAYIQRTTAALTKVKLPWEKLDNAAQVKRLFPTLGSGLRQPDFDGYLNRNAGWADAAKAIAQLYNDCIARGVTFVTGSQGTVVGFDVDSKRIIKAVRTLAGFDVQGDHFVAAAGAWISNLVPQYNSTIATGQVLGYIRLTPEEMEKYKELPIYINFTDGWFNFPPHGDTQLLKLAVHGWGYTRKPSDDEVAVTKSSTLSVPPLEAPLGRPNFIPSDGELRLRAGLREILPGLADRPFERVALCWYTDTPTGDFIIDYHPDYANLLIAGGGSGQ